MNGIDSSTLTFLHIQLPNDNFLAQKKKFLNIFYLIDSCDCSRYYSNHRVINVDNRYTEKNTVISPNFLVWKLGEITAFFAVISIEKIYWAHCY